MNMQGVKFICLLLSICYGFANTVKAFHGEAISNFQCVIMGTAITGFIFIQFGL